MRLERITNGIGRRYGDACGAAHALELVGERWALLVVRELMFGPRRFGDLRSALPGISANVLTQRLEGLEAAGVLRRRKLPPPASVQVYEVTSWGAELKPVFAVLGRWAARSPAHDPTLPISPISIMMSLETMFRADRAGDLRLTLAFRFGEESFTAEVADGGFTVLRGEAESPDAVIDGVPPALAGFVYGGAPLEALEGAGALRVTGDIAAFRRFAELFELPPKIEREASPAPHPSSR